MKNFPWKKILVEILKLALAFIAGDQANLL